MNPQVAEVTIAGPRSGCRKEAPGRPPVRVSCSAQPVTSKSPRSAEATPIGAARGHHCSPRAPSRSVSPAGNGPGSSAVFSQYAFAVYPIAIRRVGATPLLGAAKLLSGGLLVGSGLLLNPTLQTVGSTLYVGILYGQYKNVVDKWLKDRFNYMG